MSPGKEETVVKGRPGHMAVRMCRIQARPKPSSRPGHEE